MSAFSRRLGTTITFTTQRLCFSARTFATQKNQAESPSIAGKNTENGVRHINDLIQNHQELKYINPNSAHGKIIHMLAAQLPDTMKENVKKLTTGDKIESFLTKLNKSKVAILSHPEPDRTTDFMGAHPSKTTNHIASQDFHNNTMKKLFDLLLQHKDVVTISKDIHDQAVSNRRF
ncbi:hypothetical protein CL657_00315 [bacterium]|nr:hypothetical protein [bacterium]|tara:strand:- start:221 stop:748 length:528 start_codon:yes stop_codon:yes gene_type:complete